MKKRTTISVTSETSKRLHKNAKWGETLDSLINRALDIFEEQNKEGGGRTRS
jgi:hypothetical protein